MSSENATKENLIPFYTDSLITNLKTCKVIKLHESLINNISFSPDGNKILTSGNDNLICLYSFSKNEKKHLVNNIYGCDKAIFTHNTNAILVASKTDYRIMYWCIHSNEILFSFKCHSNTITELILNPVNDLFISSSLDGTSCIWDLNLRKCAFMFEDSQCCNFDTKGEIVLSVTNAFIKQKEIYENFINVYNLNEMNEKPKVFSVKCKNIIKQIKYTTDNEKIICISENNLFILNSENGKFIYNIEILEDNLVKFDITPDNKYIAIGGEDGDIMIYDMKGKNLKNYEFHTKSCNCLIFNKKYALMASSDDSNLVLWIPSEN